MPQHIMMDLGTGNNNKINWAMSDKAEFIDIVEVSPHVQLMSMNRGRCCAVETSCEL